MTNTTRIDHIVDRIYRISTFSPEFGITFNQFLIDDEQPALIHTGTYEHYEGVRSAIAEVLDPTRLAHIVLLHWEGDENGGMDRFMAQASESQLVGSALSIMLNASGFGLHARTQGFMDGQTLGLGAHRLRFLGDAARAQLGLDDGRRGDDEQPVPVRSLSPAWGPAAGQRREPDGGDARGLPGRRPPFPRTCSCRSDTGCTSIGAPGAAGRTREVLPANEQWS